MNNCGICGKQTSNKKYCSVECQHKGYKTVFTKPRINKTCEYCKKEFGIKESSLKIPGSGKYCSRKCKDLDQKQKYVGENNPMYGKKMTDEQKKKRVESAIEMWKKPEVREKIKAGINKFIENNGYYPGNDAASKQKRKNTLLQRYGHEHNWMGKYGTRPSDKTTLEKYGKTSYELMVEKLKDYQTKTKPEYVFEEHLKSLEVCYEYQYELQNRYFDFAIPHKKILVEIDGDYFHGRMKKYKELDPLQKKVRQNDIYKNRIAKNNGWTLIRVWETNVYTMIKEEVKTLIQL